MPAYVALLRSVVIAGQRVSSAPLRDWAEALGASDIATVGSTGNLVFSSRKSAPRLERELEAACAKHYGRTTEIVVKSAADWTAMVAGNPFAAEAEVAPAHLLLWAMRSPLPDSGLAQLAARARGEERIIRAPSGDIYMWFGAGEVRESKLPAGFGLKQLGAVGTNRNWNTVQKISAALRAAPASASPPHPFRRRAAHRR